TEFLYLKDANTFFAAKGGYNNESHNHNDIGSFILYKEGKPLFIDAGVGTYTKKTFSNERYDIWTMQRDRKSTRLNSSHVKTSYAVFCLKKKNLLFLYKEY